MRQIEEKLLPLSQNKSNFSPERISVAAASHVLPWCPCLPHPLSAGETPCWKGLKFCASAFHLGASLQIPPLSKCLFPGLSLQVSLPSHALR